MNKTTNEYVVVKEKKTEWQRVCFTLACLITEISLFVKMIEDDKYSTPFAIALLIMMLGIFIHYVFGKIDNVE